jgi:Tol biopolymer transport system component
VADLRTLLELREAYPLSWSRDGAWLLVASDLSGTRQLYRLPVAGGDLEQLTNYD